MPVYSNNSGFTLIEFLVAIVILMVGLLGLLQAVNVSLNHSMQNQLRNEAVNVADSRMSRELAKGFDAVSTTTQNTLEQRRVLNSNKNFNVVRTGTQYQNSKEVRFQVIWQHKGTQYTHETSGIVSKAQQ